MPSNERDQNSHRLHRRPDEVDGLQPDKLRDHAPAPSADERSAEGAKPYTTERESYTNAAVRSPTDPVERADATRPPGRGAGE